jgi:hypothetical protein
MFPREDVGAWFIFPTIPIQSEINVLIDLFVKKPIKNICKKIINLPI